MNLQGTDLSFPGAGILYQSSNGIVNVYNNLRMDGSTMTVGGTGGGSMLVYGVISGAGTFVQNAPNTTLLMNAANAYTGSTNIAQGALRHHRNQKSWGRSTLHVIIVQ